MDFHELEKIRIKYKRRILGTYAIILAIFLGFFGGIYYWLFLKSDWLNNWSFDQLFVLFALFPVFVMLVCTLIVILQMAKKAVEYRKAYKAFFIPKILAQSFTNIRYVHNAGIEKHILKQIGLLNLGDYYSSNDLVEAEYKGLKFSQADVVLAQVGAGKRSRDKREVIFEGRWMTFEFRRDFHFSLIVSHKNQKVLELSSLRKRRFQKLTVESPSFGRKFEIYGQDEFETFYILDPAFIEKVERLGDKYGGHILLIFENKKLHVAINRGDDAFEPPSPLRRIDERKETRRIKEDIRIITELVEELALDRYVFKK